MTTRLARAQELVERPSESLLVEIKRWLDPEQPAGQFQIVRAALALRNHNGGYLIIGFDNDTLKPDIDNTPADAKTLFHSDKIQGLISKFASELFEIFVDFPEIDGQPYPVLTIPSGVKSPVAAKADLLINGKSVISPNDIYIRTLNSNNIPSSSKAGWRDWARIMEICFDNRESDIGRFLRRHMSSVNPEAIRGFLSELREQGETPMTEREHIEKYFEESSERFQNEVTQRNLTLPPHGSWEVAFLINGQIPKHSLADFLSIVETNNPQLTGWPVWLVGRRFPDQKDHPYPFHGAWEQLIVGALLGLSVDFMRFDPSGKFYQRSALKEDLITRGQGHQPLSELDYVLPIIRTTESIAVGIALAKAAGCNVDSTKLSFGFRWTKLHGRKLVSWADRFDSFYPRGPARQDEVMTYVDVPLDVPLSALPEYVEKVIQPLYQVFDAFVLSKTAIEKRVRDTLERRV